MKEISDPHIKFQNIFTSKKGKYLSNDQNQYIKRHFDGTINPTVAKEEIEYAKKIESNKEQNIAIKYKIKPMASAGTLNQKTMMK